MKKETNYTFEALARLLGKYEFAVQDEIETTYSTVKEKYLANNPAGAFDKKELSANVTELYTEVQMMAHILLPTRALDKFNALLDTHTLAMCNIGVFAGLTKSDGIEMLILEEIAENTYDKLTTYIEENLKETI